MLHLASYGWNLLCVLYNTEHSTFNAHLLIYSSSNPNPKWNKNETSHCPKTYILVKDREEENQGMGEKWLRVWVVEKNKWFQAIKQLRAWNLKFLSYVSVITLLPLGQWFLDQFLALQLNNWMILVKLLFTPGLSFCKQIANLFL